MRAKIIRPFLVAVISEGLILMAASLGGKRAHASEVFRITMIWAIGFAVVTAIAVAISYNFLNNRARKPRLTSLVIAILLAMVGYVLVLVFTGGYIRNVQYPLLVVFLSGSVPAFVDAVWPCKSLAAAYSLIMILALGFSAPALFWITKRRQPTRITVVQLVPQTTPDDLKITWQPENVPDEFERVQLQKLGLHGEAKVATVYELGPEGGNLYHTLIVLTQPLVQEVHLNEGEANLTYLQRDSTWEKFPPNASLSWRKIEMYQTSSNCTAVLVWYRLDQQSGDGGPCWNSRGSH